MTDKNWGPEINTWRLYGQGLTQNRIMDMVEEWESNGFIFNRITVDDGWYNQLVKGDWEADPRRFPDFCGLVDWLHNKGYAVRLWIAPLLVHKGTDAWSRLGEKHILKKADGEPCIHSSRDDNWLNPLLPECREHIAQVLERLTSEYNFDAYKIDFLPFRSIGDESYKAIALPDREKKKILPAFFSTIRSAVDKVKPEVRLLSYPLPDCQEYLDDVMAGDFIEKDRTLKFLAGHCRNIREYIGGKSIVGWPEMLWGIGSDCEAGNANWAVSYLEWMAATINYELKLEHSFQPFNYSNVSQIRCFNNLYANAQTQYKILYAGRTHFDLHQLAKNGIAFSSRNRFLVAPEETVDVRFETLLTKTSPLDWEIISLLDDECVRWIARDENWEDGEKWHCLLFTAKAGKVYEIRYNSWPKKR